MREDKITIHDLTGGEVIENVHVTIPHRDEFCELLGISEVPLEYTQQGDIVNFKIPHGLIWMAEIWGIKITYIQSVTTSQPKKRKI